MRLVLSGVDSLVIGWSGTVDPELMRHLKAVKDAIGAGVNPGPVEAGGWTWNVLPKARPFYQVGMSDSEGRVILFLSDAPGGHPTFYVRLLSQWLWEVGPDRAVDEVRELCRRLTVDGELIGETVSRIDLATDWEGLPIPDPAHRVCRSRRWWVYGEGQVVTGLQFGKGAVVARIYDKTLEAAADKSWFYRLWWPEEGEHPDPAGRQVTRVEFQLRRDILREAGLSTWEEVRVCLADLWRYLTTEWLSFRDPGSGDRPSRRRVWEWWVTVSHVREWLTDRVAPFVRELARKVRREHVMRTARGYLVSLGALTPGRQLAELVLDLVMSFAPGEWERLRWERAVRFGVVPAGGVV